MPSKKQGVSKNRGKRIKKIHILLFGGHKTKGLGHKMGRNLGLFRCQSATAVVGLSLAFSQSLIHVMLVKSFGSSFALSVEAALALVALEPEEDKRGSLGAQTSGGKEGRRRARVPWSLGVVRIQLYNVEYPGVRRKAGSEAGTWLEGRDGKHGEELGLAEEPRLRLRLEERIRGRENGLGGTAREALRSGRDEKTFTGQEKEKQDYGRRGG